MLARRQFSRLLAFTEKSDSLSMHKNVVLNEIISSEKWKYSYKILAKFLLPDFLSRKVWQEIETVTRPIWRSQSVGRKQCGYLRNRARHSEFIMAAVTNVGASDLAANAGVKPEEIIRDHRGNYGESSERSDSKGGWRDESGEGEDAEELLGWATHSYYP